METGKADISFDLEIREGLDATNATGQVSPTFCSEIKVVDKTTSSVLETDPGSAETGSQSFIATNEVAEEAGYLVQDESVHMTGEEAGVDPNTIGQAGLAQVVSKPSDYMSEVDASSGQVHPVQLQIDISQTLRNKFRKSKREEAM